jgi:hypothetical protein
MKGSYEKIFINTSSELKQGGMIMIATGTLIMLYIMSIWTQ